MLHCGSVAEALAEGSAEAEGAEAAHVEALVELLRRALA